MKNGTRFFAIQQANRTAEIYIYGDICSYPYDPSDVSAQSIVQQIKELDTDEIRVYIDSYGGSVAEGWGIYNTLRAHPAKVITYGMGFVASAALYPFLSGDERYAAGTSAYYLHEIMTQGYGYAEDLRKMADEAEKLTEIGIAAFTERTQMDEKEVKKLMQEETWLTPEQALEKGIATALISSAQTVGPAQSVRAQIMQRLFCIEPSAKKQEPSVAETDPKSATPPAEAAPSIMQMLAGLKF